MCECGHMHLCGYNCVNLYVSFYFVTQGPPGLAGAKGEKVNFLFKYLKVSILIIYRAA